MCLRGSRSVFPSRLEDSLSVDLTVSEITSRVQWGDLENRVLTLSFFISIILCQPGTCNSITYFLLLFLCMAASAKKDEFLIRINVVI